MNTPTENLLAKLPDARRSGDNWAARCPAHGDGQASLSIGTGDDGRALIHCHAGCEPAAIVAGLGLTLADLMPGDGHAATNGHASNGKPKGAKKTYATATDAIAALTAKRGPTSATWQYIDAAGQHVGTICRWDTADGKDILPISRNGSGWHCAGMAEPRPLYRLPTLAAADVVYVTEGEKAADAARSIGLPATTSAHGAQSPGKSDWTPLNDKSVAIFPDADAAGRKYAEEVAGILVRLEPPARVKIVALPGLPEGGDIVEWIEQCHGEAAEPDSMRAEIEALVEAAEPWQPKPKAKRVRPKTPIRGLPDKLAKQIGDGHASAVSRITNAIEIPVPAKDSEEANKKILQPLPMEIVRGLIHSQTDAWPRRVDQALFVPDGLGSVSWLLEPAALFGWLASKTGIVKWHAVKGSATKGEVFAEVVRTAQRYDAIEEMPHYPPLANHFYACRDVEPGDGSAMRGLLDRFCPATDIDRDLIQAALVTQFWGGPPGSRPAFVVTADAGRGKGKSKVAEMIGRVASGSIDFSANEDMGQIKTRLLSVDALAKRIALLDNVKSLRFSWAELEAMITAATVSGKRLYVGEGRRPNTLTWFITLNGASLSTDMAQRSVIVKIGEPQRSKLWEEETTAYIEGNRWKIIADCIGFLKSEPTDELCSYSRWATWEAAVLSRLPEPSDAQRVILERQGTVDVEREEAEVIHDHFRHQLEQFRFDAARQIVFIPTAVAAEWYGQATGERRNVVATGKIIEQLIGENRLPNLTRSAGRTHGRGFLWTGELADVSEQATFDLLNRWTESKQRRRDG